MSLSFDQIFKQYLGSLSKYMSDLSVLSTSKIGIERETLRVDSEGFPVHSKHPERLGSALMHPYITTDFAENLLEFVTEPYSNPVNVLSALNNIHHVVAHFMSHKESLWPASMPPSVRSENDIPIGYYGTSNQGQLKRLYRTGLSHRYGRLMQAISGIHFNFSLPDMMIKQYAEQADISIYEAKNHFYLNIARNVHRWGFIIPYLFGSSPALHQSFLKGMNHQLLPLNQEEYYLPYATSLRLSGLGYNNAKCQFFVSTNELSDYIHDLSEAVSKPCQAFSRLGIKDKEGHYLQMSDSILQIENEFYTSLRLKQIPQKDERPLCALKRRGVEYVELRSIDVSPFSPMGIAENDVYFLRLFMVFCAIYPADALNKESLNECQQNLKIVAEQGRKPNLEIHLAGQPYVMKELMQHLLAMMELLLPYFSMQEKTAWEDAVHKVENIDATPSAQILSAIKETGKSLQDYFLDKSVQYVSHYRNQPLPKALEEQFTKLATESLHKQGQLELEKQIPFDDYLNQFLGLPCH